jgi:hypothetical protein
MPSLLDLMVEASELRRALGALRTEGLLDAAVRCRDDPASSVRLRVIAELVIAGDNASALEAIQSEAEG